MSRPATAELSLARAETTELAPVLPALASGRLQALLLVHARVTSSRHLARVASPDGTWHHLPDGPVMRVRTAELTPVPERTPR